MYGTYLVLKPTHNSSYHSTFSLRSKLLATTSSVSTELFFPPSWRLDYRLLASIYLYSRSFLFPSSFHLLFLSRLFISFHWFSFPFLFLECFYTYLRLMMRRWSTKLIACICPYPPDLHIYLSIFFFIFLFYFFFKYLASIFFLFFAFFFFFYWQGGR